MACAREGADVVVLARGAERLETAGARVGDRAAPIVFTLTPRGQMIDVIHVRSFAPGHATDQPAPPP